MKKLFFASVFALASLTACQNETTDREVMPPGIETMKAQEAAKVASQNEAEEIVKAIELYNSGAPDNSGRMRVLCSVNHALAGSGHACVQSMFGTVYGVDWNDGSYPLPKHDDPYYWTSGQTHYVIYQQSNCNCR